jgi:hypothetical protein
MMPFWLQFDASLLVQVVPLAAVAMAYFGRVGG